MAYPNKLLHNPKTGQDIRFLQTGKSGILEMESIYPAKSKEPAPHYHPFQSEDFLVLEGALSVRIDGAVKIIKKGDSLHIPPNKIHSMWNNTSGQTVVNWKVQPPLKTEYFLETVCGLAQDNKTNQQGMPGILQVALLANHFSREFRLSAPPFFLQKLLFLLLTPFALVLGYRPLYKKYLD